MQLSDKAKETIEKIHLISGEKKEDTKSFFEALGIYIILNYYGQDEIYLPYIGKLRFNYLGDELIQNSKQAKVDLEFEPDSFLLKNIGQIEDDDIPDVVKLFQSRIQSTLGEYLGEEILVEE